MTAVELRPGPETVDQPGRTPSTIRVLLWALALCVVVAGIVVVRAELEPPAPVRAVSVAHPAAATPVSAAIEATWGIRITGVDVVADDGGVEVRYLVLDDAKAGKLHGDSPTTDPLPTVVDETTHGRITPSAVLMHFHHAEDVNGRAYSVVYGNAGSVVRSGDFVSVVMTDGLTLHHVQVSD